MGSFQIAVPGQFPSSHQGYYFSQGRLHKEENNPTAMKAVGTLLENYHAQDCLTTGVLPIEVVPHVGTWEIQVFLENN
jgi:hypothetical protein